MTKITNPYESPKSIITDSNTKHDDGDQLFSPLQACLAAFLGGPLAGTYAIRHNFLALDDADNAKRFTLAGLLITMLLVVSSPFLPDNIPGTAISIIWVVLTAQVMKKYHPSKDEIQGSAEYEFKSNWTVAGTALACLLITAACLLVWAGIAIALGWIAAP